MPLFSSMPAPKPPSGPRSGARSNRRAGPLWVLLAWLALVLAVLASLAGCTVGPNYKRPQVTLAAHYGELESHAPGAAVTAGTITTNTPAPEEWWRLFQDPLLDKLIATAARQNYGLQVAAARIRQARALRGIAAAELFPQVAGSAGYNRARGSENVELPLGGGGSGGSGGTGTTPAPRLSAATVGANSGLPENQLNPFGKGGLPGATTELYQAGFDANWELDLFGGTRRRVEAARADWQAAIEERREVLVSLCAEVARDYLQLRGTQRRLEVARRNIAAQQDVLELTRSLRQAGLADDLDAARAATQLALTRAAVPPLEARIRLSIHALSTLLAREPEELSAELTATRPLPVAPPEVPVGLPSELLEQRPDVRRAERELAAATARIGQATADVFPKFTLTGSAGVDATSLDDLFKWPSRYYSVSPTAVWPIFDAGRILSNVRLQQGNAAAARLQYHDVILTAFREVEDALAAYGAEQARRAALAEALDQSRQAVALARERYQRGLVDFLTVLDAQRTALTAEDALAESDQTVDTDVVALYKALGGGWKMTVPAGETPQGAPAAPASR